MAMGGYNYYDIAGAAAGMNVAMTPEERQMQKLTNMIKAAEATNYDGDTEYYQQIKALAMQAGVPIKNFKTNPFRMAKAGLLSFADTALLGLVPNDWYTPMNSAEEAAAGIGSVGGMLLPWGAPAKLARGAMGAFRGAQGAAKGAAGAGAWKGFQKGFGKYGWDPFKTAGAGAATRKKSKAVADQAKKVTKKKKTKVIPPSRQIEAPKQKLLEYKKRKRQGIKEEILPKPKGNQKVNPKTGKPYTSDELIAINRRGQRNETIGKIKSSPPKYSSGGMKPKPKAKAGPKKSALISDKAKAITKPRRGRIMQTSTANYEKPGALKPRKAKKAAQGGIVKKDKISVKTVKVSKPSVKGRVGVSKQSLSKSDEKRIVALMKPKARKRYQKAKGYKKTEFALTWAKASKLVNVT
jgi:hypothetical protein